MAIRGAGAAQRKADSKSKTLLLIMMARRLLLWRLGPKSESHAAGFGHVIGDALADELLPLLIEAASNDRQRRPYEIEAAASAALPGRKRRRIPTLPWEKWLRVSAALVHVSVVCGFRGAPPYVR
jgi:hypothetical protein